MSSYDNNYNEISKYKLTTKTNRINNNNLYNGMFIGIIIGTAGYFLYNNIKKIPTKEYKIVIKLRGSVRGVKYTIEDLNNNVLIPKREAPTSWTNITINTTQPSIIIKPFDHISNAALEIESILQDNKKLPQTVTLSRGVSYQLDMV